MKFTLGLALVAVAVTSFAAADDCSFGCLDVYEPVCGSDGKMYSNACYLRLASCQSNNQITEANGGCTSTPESTPSPSTTPKPATSTTGSANVVCPDACLDVYDPVSDENGVEYSNECYMQMAKCKGSSGDDDNNNNNNDKPGLDAQRKLAFAPDYKGPACGDMMCPDNYAPVCGSDGVTYSNECNLGIASCNYPERNITQVGDDACLTPEQQQEQQQQQQQH